MAFWRLYYHLGWATRNRERLIQPHVEEQLFSHLLARATEIDVRVYAVNGWYDHVHLVVAAPPTLAVADVVKHLKGSSAHYMNDAGLLPYHFAWHPGYGAMTIGERHRSVAEEYVRNQKEHHARQTTNRWLEHFAELEEGPGTAATAPDVLPVREEPARYDVWEEPLF